LRRRGMRTDGAAYAEKPEKIPPAMLRKKSASIMVLSPYYR
jgi:hypothetical protein